MVNNPVVIVLKENRWCPLCRKGFSHQCVIDISPRLREALPKCPLHGSILPYPEYRDLLMRVAFEQQKETYKGNSPGYHPSSKTCAHIKMGTMLVVIQQDPDY